MLNAIKKILLVDDEERLLNSMAQRLTLLGFEAIKASSGTMALEIASKTQIDLAIVDLKMPDMDGLTTITRLKQILPELKTVLLTGYGSDKIRKKTEMLDSRYFEKDSMADLWDVIKQFNSQGNVVIFNPPVSPANFLSSDASEEHLSQEQIDSVNEMIDARSGTPVSRSFVDTSARKFSDQPKIIGETPQMQRLRKDIERLSELDCTIIIRGETGTGKELTARTIHSLSHRKGQRFLAFNCGCFSTDFQFNELLGSLGEPLARSDSKQSSSRESRFIGTIFLDHFEVMPEMTQQEMLKIIDNMAADRSTDTPETRDIRFIVATHQDLREKVTEGKFNKTLFHRLNAIEMAIPPLRERTDDISPLCSYMLNRLNREFEKKIESVSDEVLSILTAYPFPGNVRELKHIIERAVIIADTSLIEPLHLPERLRESVSVPPDRKEQNFMTLNELEQQHILQILEATGGNKTKTAELLGISRAALWRKLKLIT